MKIQSSTVQEDEIQHSIQTQHVKRRRNKKNRSKQHIQHTNQIFKRTVQTLDTNTTATHKHNFEIGQQKNRTQKNSKHENNTHSTAYKHNKQHNKQNATNYNTKKKSRFRLSNAANDRKTT